jgi:hypothetical protein
MKMMVQATLPDGLLEEWLEVLTQFDKAHPGCDFKIAMEGQVEAEDMIRRMQPFFRMVRKLELE